MSASIFLDTVRDNCSAMFWEESQNTIQNIQINLLKSCGVTCKPNHVRNVTDYIHNITCKNFEAEFRLSRVTCEAATRDQSLNPTLLLLYFLPRQIPPQSS